MATKKVIYGLTGIGVAAIAATAITVPLLLKKEKAKESNPYANLIKGNKLSDKQRTIISTKPLISSLAASFGNVKSVYAPEDKKTLSVIYSDKTNKETTILFDINNRKMLAFGQVEKESGDIQIDGSHIVIEYTYNKNNGNNSTPKIISSIPSNKTNKEVIVSLNAKTNAVTNELSSNSWDLHKIKEEILGKDDRELATNQSKADEVKSLLESLSVTRTVALTEVNADTPFEESILTKDGSDVVGSYPDLSSYKDLTLTYTTTGASLPNNETHSKGTIVVKIESKDTAIENTTATIQVKVVNPSFKALDDYKTSLLAQTYTAKNTISAATNGTDLTTITDLIPSLPTLPSGVTAKYTLANEITPGSSGNLSVVISDGSNSLSPFDLPISVETLIIDLQSELAKVQDSYNSVLTEGDLSTFIGEKTAAEIGIFITGIDSRAQMKLTIDRYESSTKTLKVKVELSAPGKTLVEKNIDVFAVPFDSHIQATINKYRDDTKKLFENKYSDQNGTSKIDVDASFDSLTTIDAIFAKSEELIAAGVYNPPTPGAAAEASIIIPDIPKEAIEEFKQWLIYGFKEGFYTTDGADGSKQDEVDTSEFSSANTINELKSALDVISANKFYREATITPGKITTVTVPTKPTFDSLSNTKLIPYEALMDIFRVKKYDETKIDYNAQDTVNLLAAAKVKLNSKSASSASIFSVANCVDAVLDFSIEWSEKLVDEVNPSPANSVSNTKLKNYKNNLKALFDIKVDTSSIDDAKDEATAAKAAKEIATFDAKKIKDGKQLDSAEVIDFAMNLIHFWVQNDSSSPAQILGYKTTLENLFKDKYTTDGSTVGPQNKVDLSTIKNANTLEEAKAAADTLSSIPLYTIRNVIAGTKINFTVPDPTVILIQYKNNLMNLFKDKYTTDGSAKGPQTPVDVSGITNANTLERAKTAAEELKSNGLFDKVTEGQLDNQISTIAKPLFDSLASQATSNAALSIQQIYIS